jgi:hypothetical protein
VDQEIKGACVQRTDGVDKVASSRREAERNDSRERRPGKRRLQLHRNAGRGHFEVPELRIRKRKLRRATRDELDGRRRRCVTNAHPRPATLHR